ncbi:MAG: CarD family transcriptional regulator [Eubacteriales bacterium]|jgi:CarD family transcriptional regulator
MYKKGEYIVYGSSGPCLVTDITRLDMPGCDRKRKYYVLRPVISNRSTIYCPVDNQKVKTRDVMGPSEAKEMLSDIADMPSMKIDNEKKREDQYREVLRNTNFRDWISMLKMLVLRRQIRADEGRKFTSVDERYLREVGDIATCELSIALGEDRNKVHDKLVDLIG